MPSQKPKKDYSKSRFKAHIRIDPKQKEFIRAAKKKYTLAGKLDEIINFYRRNRKKI